MQDDIDRMLNAAKDRLHDAEILGTSLAVRSDSAALLRILALEVLLKAANLATNGEYTFNHGYVGLWESLGPDVRGSVLRAGSQRYAGCVDLSDVDGILKDLHTVFVKGRYYYEFYKGRTLDDQRQEGAEWIARGGDLTEAKLRCHPMEVFALAHGLITHLETGRAS